MIILMLQINNNKLICCFYITAYVEKMREKSIKSSFCGDSIAKKKIADTTMLRTYLDN